MPDSFRDGAHSSYSTVLRNLLRLQLPHPCVPEACRTRQRSTSRRHVPASYTKLRTTHWPDETDPTAKQALLPSAGSGQGSPIRYAEEALRSSAETGQNSSIAVQTKLYSPRQNRTEQLDSLCRRSSTVLCKNRRGQLDSLCRRSSTVLCRNRRGQLDCHADQTVLPSAGTEQDGSPDCHCDQGTKRRCTRSNETTFSSGNPEQRLNLNSLVTD